jgi:hypothetical protein
MLVRLLYASRADDNISQDELLRILTQSKSNNPASGITGVLCSSGRIFMQVLEGGRMQVNALYNKIAADPRHQDLAILLYEEISERKFAGWSMCGSRSLLRLRSRIHGLVRRTDGNSVNHGSTGFDTVRPLTSTQFRS